MRSTSKCNRESKCTNLDASSRAELGKENAAAVFIVDTGCSTQTVLNHTQLLQPVVDVSHTILPIAGIAET